MSELISAENVTKVYNAGMPDEVTALHGVSMSVEREQVTVLIGPSGSGKTALLSLIGCMSRPTSGSVIVDGRNVSKLPERFLTEVRRKTFGFVFQQFHLIKDVSVLENVLLPLYPLRAGFSEMRERAEGVIDRVKLSGKRHIKAGKLSGGEQQRVAIARALVNDPDVVIADEPTAHLDTELSRELLGILGGLNDEGKTVVIATHDPLVFEHPFVRRRIVMRDGRVEIVGEA